MSQLQCWGHDKGDTQEEEKNKIQKDEKAPKSNGKKRQRKASGSTSTTIFSEA